MIDQIQWIGHGSFIVQGPPLIYINPWRVARKTFLADVILIGHDHYEHFSASDIDNLRGESTIILTNEVVAEQVEGAQVLRPWHSMLIDGARITAVPAYSVDDYTHPQEDGGLGFVIAVNLHDIYYAGDTQLTPEMDRITPDIAILPIDGNGTLNAEQAAEWVKRKRPKYSIPSNWGAPGVGTSAPVAAANRFKQLVGSFSQVRLMEDSI